jgi:hypothetical protein
VTTPLRDALTESSISTLVACWYQALDRHDAIEDVLPFLVDDGLEMRFPETTARGHEGFRQWYDAVTHRFFDEVHTLVEVTVGRIAPDGADVAVAVNWQAKIWDAPAPKTAWLGFDAYQTWRVVPGTDGTPLILTYTVDRLEPMPGSAAL